MQRNQPSPDTQVPSTLERYGGEAQPEALLVACADLPLDARLLREFQRQPLVVWRTTGPIVPPYGSGELEAERVVEHAVTRLQVKEIAVCGHLPCKPLRDFLARQTAGESDSEPDRLAGFEAAFRMVQKRYGPLEPDQLLAAVTEENVLLQAAHLRTYPAVLSAVASGTLRLHRWLYDADEDELYGYGASQSLFLSRIEGFAPAGPTALPDLDPCDIYLA